MTRKTSEIVADLRAQIEIVEKMFSPCALSDVMREASNRLEKAWLPVPNSRLVDARYRGEQPLINSLPVGLMKAAQAFDAGAQWHAQAIEDGKL